MCRTMLISICIALTYFCLPRMPVAQAQDAGVSHVFKSAIAGGADDADQPAGEKTIAPDVQLFQRFLDKPFKASLERLTGNGIIVTFRPIFAPSRGTYAWKGTAKGTSLLEAIFVLRLIDRNQPKLYGAVYFESSILSVEPRGREAQRYVVQRLKHSNHLCSTVSHLGTGTADPAVSCKITEVDVAFVYASRVREQAKEIDPAAPDALIEGRIDVALSNLNDVLTNSGAKVRLRAAAVEFMDEPFEEVDDSATNLEWITNKGDGHWDAAHTIRTSAKADLVCWIVGRGGSRAHVLKSPDLGSAGHAFSVVRFVKIIPARYVLAHELAHNLGCCHEASQVMADCACHARGWAFQADGVHYTTIMCVQDQDKRIPRFSNPNKMYDGVKTGHPTESFNVKEMNTNAPIVTTFNGG